MIFICILAAVLTIAALYLFMMIPSLRRRDMSAFTGKIIAHRGLHGEGVCESSLSAFRAAVDAGYPIELDINVSADGECFVIHDDHLMRLCGEEVFISEMNLGEIKKYRLTSGGEAIPALTDVLNLVDGRVPLLIELKGASAGRAEALCRALKSYRGAFAVQSFNPLYLYKIRRAMRHVPIGFLTKRSSRGMRGMMFAFFSRNLLFNFLFRPDFVSFKYDEKQTVSVKLCRKMGVPVLGWTFDINKIPKGNSFDGYIAE